VPGFHIHVIIHYHIFNVAQCIIVLLCSFVVNRDVVFRKFPCLLFSRRGLIILQIFTFCFIQASDTKP